MMGMATPPIRLGSTTAGTRSIPAGSTGAVALLQAGLMPECAPRAWAVTLASEGVVAGQFVVRSGDDFGAVEFVVPFALGRRFAELTVGGKNVFVQFEPAAAVARDYQVGATVGLFAG